jgi:uncharacterized protein (TIGR00106 family)
MIIAELSITPIGSGTSVSKYVKIALDALKKSGIYFETNAMATVIETKDIDELFDVIKRAHNAVLEAGVKRVITHIKIDDRKDKEVTIKSKLDAIK